MRCPGRKSNYHQCKYEFEIEFITKNDGKKDISFPKKTICPICDFNIKDFFKSEEELLEYSTRMIQQKEYSSAKIALEFACRKFNSTKAMILYAQLYFNGWGIEKNPKNAIIFLTKASSLNDKVALNMLIDVLWHGKYGLEKDLKSAYSLAKSLEPEEALMYAELFEEFVEEIEVKPLGILLNIEGTIEQLFLDDTLLNISNVISDEQSRLSLTINEINEHISLLESSIDKIDSFTDVNSDSYFDWQTSQKRNSGYYEEINVLQNSLSEPYHTRIRLIDEAGNIEDYYIGYEDCITDKNNKIIIHSWTSPLGNIYSNEIDDEFYINGNLYKLDKKRKLFIKDSELLTAEEVYNSKTGTNYKSYDDYLLKVLEYKKKESEVTNIIATIQHQQNQIIRSDFNKHLVMQGCAGSGKTMVMFHRLKYMLANNMADNNDFVIITPSNRFNKDMLPMLKSLKLSVSMYSIDNFYIYLLNLYTGWKWDGLFHKGYSTSTRTGSNGQTLHGKTTNFDCDELVLKNDYHMDRKLVEYFYSLEFREKINSLEKVKIKNITQGKVEKATNEDHKIDLRKLLLGKNESALFPDGSLVPGVIHKCELFALAMLFYKRCGVNKYKPDTNKNDLIGELLFKHLFIDEVQDLSKSEIIFLNSIGNFYDDRVFHIFGDINQSIYPYSLKTWDEVSDVIGNVNLYNYNKNYRNTEEVVKYTNELVDFEIESIGFSGNVVQFFDLSSITELIKNNLEKRFAVICSLKRRKILRKEYPEYAKYFMDLSSVKGLEFDHVAVLLPGLTKIEQYIACTRTLNDLYIIK